MATVIAAVLDQLRDQVFAGVSDADLDATLRTMGAIDGALRHLALTPAKPAGA